MDALRPWPYLQHHSATERRTHIGNVAAEGERARAVRLWRTPPPLHKKCVSSLRFGCVINAKRRSIPQQNINLSAPLHPDVVVTQNCQLKCESSSTQTWTADPVRVVTRRTTPRQCRDQAHTQWNPRRLTDINEARDVDAVPGSHDSITRGVLWGGRGHRRCPHPRW